MRCTLSVAVIGMIALLAPGCSPSPGNFNDTLADLQKKMTGAEKKVEDTLEHPPNDVSKNKKANEEFRDAVADARKKYNELKVPQGEAAKKFHTAFGEYLQSQEAAVPLYKAFLDPDKPLTGEEDKSKREELDKVRWKRNGQMQPLRNAQADYAREAGFELKKE